MKIDRTNPFLSKIKERYLLTKEGSTKKTYHIVLDLKNSGVVFKVGDSIAIYPQNDPVLVERLISAMKVAKDALITDTRSGKVFTVKDFLTQKANLSRLTTAFLKLSSEAAPLLENKPLLTDYLSSHEPVDFFKEYSTEGVPLETLCAQFSPLLPRFYSIASSLNEAPDEVHLTVALTEFTCKGEKRYGVASHFLCHLAEEMSTHIPLYVQPSQDFTLPQDHNTHIIMIGPGTGVAPFRAFMQERIKADAQGKHWLFFGERNRNSDYFYEDFWHSHHVSGKLRLDLAFSRDQEHKHYVQHKMYENGKDFWDWIQEGSIIYVCGNADPMAKDVEATLLTIAKEHGTMEHDEAKAYVKSLRKQKRLIFDIY